MPELHTDALAGADGGNSAGLCDSNESSALGIIRAAVPCLVKELWHLCCLARARLPTKHYRIIVADGLHDLLLHLHHREALPDFLHLAVALDMNHPV